MSSCLPQRLVAFCLLPLIVAAQTTPLPQSPPPNASPAVTGFALEDGTPVKLRLSRSVSSADAHVGDSVDFEVLEEVSINGTVVVPKGGLALGTVTEAQPKRRMARGGKLDMNIDSVRLADGEKAALRAVKESKGGGHTGAMTAGIVATGLLVWPAAPFFLFMHGKDVTVPKGAEITAYVNGDMKLDAARFQPAPPSPVVAAKAQADPAAPTQLDISSTPPGADIEIDGNFVGNTPSAVGVSMGEHQLSVRKSGFKPWERKLSVSTGHINVDATLESEGK